MRETQLWNEGWRFAKTNVLPQTPPEAWQAVTLPHTWNAVDGQDGGNDYWRGTACYCKAFVRQESWTGRRVFVEFKGAAMTADVYLNGKKLAHHAGGYSTFRTELTDCLQEQNLLAVLVDNSENDTVYPQKADFTFYGGIYRDVNLIVTEQDHFELCRDGTLSLCVTPQVDLANHRAVLSLTCACCGGDTVHFSVPTEDGLLQCDAPVQNGCTCGTFTVESVHLWNGLDDPYLYTATAELRTKGAVQDTVSLRFGCRTIAVDPEKGFFLNGRSYPLRGVARHQDRQGLGNALTRKEHAEDLALIREIGANSVRLAHYQHAQEFYDLCDEAGLIVWAEIPYITMHMAAGRQNTLDQMRELITQCYHHPSIVCWGLSNEITASGKVDEDLMENHRLLNELCHKMDPTRPTAMAHAFMLEQDSPLINTADLGGYNLYFGWYLGELEQNDSFFDEYHAAHPERCIGFTEFGADANPAYHDDAPEKGDYTEEYQCRYHEHILRCIEQRPYIWAAYVWNMFDFAADGRDEGGKHGQNQKGLVTFDRKTRKDAFYLYKAAWNRTEPFVHICGSRYVDRPGTETVVKVYSNLNEVTLYLDGEEVASRRGKAVFTFTVPIIGEHTLLARAGNCMDSIKIRKTDKPNPAYSFMNKGDVVNWFDKANFNAECFSIEDTFGALTAHPEAGRLVNAFMDKVRASRGDVAKTGSQNKNLQRMMSGMKFSGLLKQAGKVVTGQEIAALNTALQKIHKDS